MSKLSYDPARMIPIYFRINRSATKTFVWTENGVDFDITNFTWELFIKRYPGDRLKVISLTLGNGLSYQVYEDNRLISVFTETQTDIQEGQYYWELVRTDINRTYLNGWAYFTYGPADSQ